ncbi:GL16448 [Drosophila persimilis]|uniref:GL16448 n=1 Tax=Drosophila persimilis TaxID=7234 RepID=B4GWG0_DROPE|nr:GL16448 [Drosophila persimilis]
MAFFCMLKLKDVSATGEGASKNMAKQVAALCVWKKILKIPVISAILNQSDASPMMATSALALFGEDHLLSLKQRKKLRDLLVLVATNIEGEPLPIAEPIAEHIVEPIAESIPIPKKTPASLGIYELPYPDVGPVVKNQQTLKCTAEAKVPPLMHVKPNPSTIRKKAPESLGNNRSPYPYEEAAEKTVSGNSLKLEPRYGRNIPDPGPTSYGVRTHLLQDDYFFKFPKDLKEAAFKVINSKDFETKKEHAEALLAALLLIYIIAPVLSREAAFKVINSKDFETKKEQAEALLAALQLNYTMAPVPCKNTKYPLVSLTLHCDYNGLFIDQKSNIYDVIIEYLNDMLR